MKCIATVFLSLVVACEICVGALGWYLLLNFEKLHP